MNRRSAVALCEVMMRSRFSKSAIGALTVALTLAGAVRSEPTAGVDQDPHLLRFFERAIPWYPDSSFKIVSNERHQTAAGSYRIVMVDRACASDGLSGESGGVIDDVAETIWLGSAASLPFGRTGIAPTALMNFVEDFIPEALQSTLRLKARVDWKNPPSRAGALIPFWLRIDTGYGEYGKAAAVSSDGRYFVLGPFYGLDEDPVEKRRSLLAGSEMVIWDHPGGEGPLVEIVEFSDLECPACRIKWPMVREVLGENGNGVRHGMVSFPLTTIHPWAFRSACASWCVSEQDSTQLLPFKELFYELQTDMAVSLVTPTSRDFVAGNGLDEEAFNSCYLRSPSLAAVHGQLALGHSIGVQATPTYVVNGHMVQFVSEDWFPAMIERLLEGEEL
jgi:protein-disulfide isomerase